MDELNFDEIVEPRPVSFLKLKIELEADDDNGGVFDDNWGGWEADAWPLVEFEKLISCSMEEYSMGRAEAA